MGYMTLRFVGALLALATITLYQGAVLAAGDPERGKSLYGVCSTCHGEKAEGLQEMNAPALAGRESWYIIRQLQNFKSGVRGTDPGDTYGLQMAPMAQLLTDKQAMEDVAAYLSSLGD
jgi:cytochrome c oxidase subunit 2